MKRNLFLFVAAMLVAGCAAQTAVEAPTGGAGGTTTPIVSHGGPVDDYASLIDALRAAGATVEPAGEVEQPFFSVKARMIKVDGADVQVFEYVDEAAAQADAAKVGPDGSTFDTLTVDWIAPPHFYHKGRAIVLYVGDDAAIQRMLEDALGAQIAGGK